MFAVHGIDPIKLRAKAQKMAETRARKVKGKKNERPAAEFEAEIYEELLRTTPPERISPEYSMPSTCNQYLLMAEKEGYLRCAVFIRAPMQTTDKKGRNKVVQRYVPYVAGNDYSLKKESA